MAKPNRTVTFPWGTDGDPELDYHLRVLQEHSIGYIISSKGLTVEVADGTSEDECRRLMAEAVERRKSSKRGVTT